MKALIAEDDATSRRLLEASLRKWGYDVTVCTDGAQALEVLQKEDAPRIAILDWMMPEMDGVQVCRELRKHRREPYTYVLLLTAKSQKQDLVEGMDAGADDYVTKPFDPHELRARLRAGTRILQLQNQLIAARERLRKQATHDPLTGLWNHSSILDILSRELSRSKREDTPLGCLMLDIDHFKCVNDTYGHVTGDAVLREVARRVSETVREYDAPGRFGGDECLIVLPGCDAEKGMEAAERLRERIAREPVETPKGPIPVTVSVGVSTNAEYRGLHRDALVSAADAALYRAKNSGRNRTELATEDDLAARTPTGTPESRFA